MKRRREAVHGTDSGYYRHRRKPDPENGWPKVACQPCTDAHAAAARGEGGKPRPPRAGPRTCPGCGTRIQPRSKHCRSCAQLAAHDGLDGPVEWVREGLIWKAAS